MTDKEFEKLMEQVRRIRDKKETKEETLQSLIDCGLLDKDGYFVVPGMGAFMASVKTELDKNV